MNQKDDELAHSANGIKASKHPIERIFAIRYGQVEIEYANDYWDGPLAGVCKWKVASIISVGTEVWMRRTKKMIRRFVLIRLPSDELQRHKERHRVFTKMKEEGKTEDFYNQSGSEQALVLDKNWLIGWFKD